MITSIYCRLPMTLSDVSLYVSVLNNSESRTTQIYEHGMQHVNLHFNASDQIITQLRKIHCLLIFADSAALSLYYILIFPNLVV